MGPSQPCFETPLQCRHRTPTSILCSVHRLGGNGNGSACDACIRPNGMSIPAACWHMHACPVLLVRTKCACILFPPHVRFCLACHVMRTSQPSQLVLLLVIMASRSVCVCAQPRSLAPTRSPLIPPPPRSLPPPPPAALGHPPPPPPRYGIQMRVHDRHCSEQSRSAKQKSKKEALQ